MEKVRRDASPYLLWVALYRTAEDNPTHCKSGVSPDCHNIVMLLMAWSKLIGNWFSGRLLHLLFKSDCIRWPIGISTILPISPQTWCDKVVNLRRRCGLRPHVYTFQWSSWTRLLNIKPYALPSYQAGTASRVFNCPDGSSFTSMISITDGSCQSKP